MTEDNSDKNKDNLQQPTVPPAHMSKASTPTKDISPDKDMELEPVISRNEFKALEDTEQKKKLFGFLKSLKKDNNGKEDEGRIASIHELEKKLNDNLLKVEKLDGKFEMIETSKSEHSERISNLAEEIGELRSMIFSREDSLGKVETEFEEIKESTLHMKPEKIHREIEEQTTEVMKVQAQLELQKSKIDHLGKNLENVTKIMSKFKSYENLVELSKGIKKQVENVNDSEKYASRMAAKTEKIFGELDERLSEFQKYKKQIDDMNEVLGDLMKSQDSLEIKTNSLMSKDSLTKIIQTQENKFKEQDTRIKILKDIASALVDKVSTRGVSISSTDLSALRSDVHDDVLRTIEERIPSDLETKIRSLDDLSNELNTKLHHLDSALSSLKDNKSVESDLKDSPLEPKQKDLIEQIADLSPSRIIPSVIDNPSDMADDGGTFIVPENQEQSETTHLQDTDKSRIANLPSIPEMPNSSSVSASVSGKLHKMKNIIKNIKSNPKKPVPKLGALVQSCNTKPETQLINHHENKSAPVKNKPIEPVIEQPALRKDLKSEILRLKAVFGKKLDVLEKEKDTGKDIIRQQILLDNASLDLSMAELDLMDGNKDPTIKKLEKVSAILENIR